MPKIYESNVGLLVLGFCIVFMGAALESSADTVLKWHDNKGHVHYGERVPVKYRGSSQAITLSLTNTVRQDHKHVVKSKSLKVYGYQTPMLAPRKENNKPSLAETCKKKENEYKGLTTIRHGSVRYNSDGTPKIESIVYSDENGKTLYTRREQNRIAEKMRIKYNRKGCNISQTKNMKL